MRFLILAMLIVGPVSNIQAMSCGQWIREAMTPILGPSNEAIASQINQRSGSNIQTPENVAAAVDEVGKYSRWAMSAGALGTGFFMSPYSSGIAFGGLPIFMSAMLRKNMATFGTLPPVAVLFLVGEPQAMAVSAGMLTGSLLTDGFNLFRQRSLRQKYFSGEEAVPYMLEPSDPYEKDPLTVILEGGVNVLEENLYPFGKPDKK